MCSQLIKKVPIIQRKIEIKNITVTRAPLLKAYYWEYFDIDGLNKKLQTGETLLEHTLLVPTRQINSKPLKVVFWILNPSDDVLELRLRRVKNCECVPVETRVGFNQFRQLYHCPHRRLINILQENIVIQPQELVAMSVVSYFFLFGLHKLTFVMDFGDDREVTLNFLIDIIGFDPNKCIITKELIPVNLNEHRRFVQPIWVRNITMQNLNFIYSSNTRGFKLINPKLTVPRQSVWPLMVEYLPSESSNELELTLNFNSERSKFQILAKGITDTMPPDTYVPVEDLECSDFSYVIFPNKLEFDVEANEERSLMVSIHNYNQKCVEFRWQKLSQREQGPTSESLSTPMAFHVGPCYIINDLFEITFDPDIFRLKPHHSKLCLVKLRVHERPLHFKRIPTVLEVHRIFDKSTRIARELLEEVESIDDPKCKEDSYLMHVFLHLNLKVNFKKIEQIEIMEFVPTEPSTTIFEKLFWPYLSQSKFMRENTKPTVVDDLSYDEVLAMNMRPPKEIMCPEVNKNVLLNILSHILAEGVSELAKNWTSIPLDFLSPL